MRDETFEWDDAKAAGNALKHGITFVTATEIFYDPNAIDEPDKSEDYGEERYRTIGRAKGRLLFVVYTIRNGRVRIISARAAEPHEQRKYWKG